MAKANKLPANLKLTAQPKDLSLMGEVELLAADGEQKGGGEGRFMLASYTGKPVNVGGFEHPVIVDLSGATFDRKVTPVIADHETTKRIGHTLEQAIIPAGSKASIGGKSYKGPFIGAVGTRSSDMEIAKGFVADARKGFPFQVSIGARIKKAYLVAEDDTVEVNGKIWQGPLIVAQKSVIRELSVTVLGADNDTEAIITAKLKENRMDFEAWVESLGLTLADLTDDQKGKLEVEFKAKSKPAPRKKKLKLADPEGDDDDDDEPPARRKVKRKLVMSDGSDDDDDGAIRAAEAEERVDSIREIATQFSDVKEIKLNLGGKETKLSMTSFKSHAIRNKWSPEKFELECRRAEIPTMNTPAIHMVDKTLDTKALEVALLRASNVPTTETNRITGRPFGIDQFYDTKALEMSHRPEYNLNNSIDRLHILQIQAAGRHVTRFDAMQLKEDAFYAWRDLKASGFSSLSITNVLENVMHKAAWSGFESAETTWRQICSVRSLSDFRVHNMYRLDFNGHFRKVGPDGELKHISLTDMKKTIQAETYGAMIAVDRKTQINDDLGIVVQKARSFGSLGGLRVDELVYTTLLSNPSSFFAAGNNNLMTGAGSVLGVPAFEVARRKFRDQIINGKPIAVSPSILLVGTGLETKANRLYTQDRMAYAPTTADFNDNPFVGLYRPVVSGYLNNSSITDQDGLGITGQSNTQWYLFPNPGAPQGSAIQIGFLNGRQTPYFEEAETQFNIVGGIQMRAYYDFGVAMHITQMGLRSAGG